LSIRLQKINTIVTMILIQLHIGILNVKTPGKTSLIVNNKLNSICDDFEPKISQKKVNLFGEREIKI